MRLVLLRGITMVLALVTAIAVLAFPLWVFIATASSMLQPKPAEPESIGVV
jgi:hypothetical protein